MSELKDRIVEIRKAQRLNQENFANAIGVSRSTLSQIEIGKHNPTIESIIQIARIYNISYKYLLEGEGEMHSDQSVLTVHEPQFNYKNKFTEKDLYQMRVDINRLRKDENLVADEVNNLRGDTNKTQMEIEWIKSELAQLHKILKLKK